MRGSHRDLRLQYTKEMMAAASTQLPQIGKGRSPSIAEAAVSGNTQGVRRTLRAHASTQTSPSEIKEIKAVHVQLQRMWTVS